MYTMKNGRVVSEETADLALRTYFEANPEKPKFEPIEIHGGCFVVSVTPSGYHVKIETGDDYNGSHCEQSTGEVDEFIDALQKAKAFVEANK